MTHTYTELYTRKLIVIMDKIANIGISIIQNYEETLQYKWLNMELINHFNKYFIHT